MGTPAPGQARRQHDGEFNDAAQLPVVFDRFRTVCRMRSPTQGSIHAFSGGHVVVFRADHDLVVHRQPDSVYYQRTFGNTDQERR